jgi:hypothetical protein
LVVSMLLSTTRPVFSKEWVSTISCNWTCLGFSTFARWLLVSSHSGAWTNLVVGHCSSVVQLLWLSPISLLLC